MATFYQSGSWSSSSILAGYGLSAVIGPQTPTASDVKRLNSRSGGSSKLKGNWMQTFNPKPVQGSGRPKVMYNYDFEETPVIQQRQPGLESRKVAPFKGFKKPKAVKLLAPSTDIQKSQIKPVNGSSGLPSNPDLINELRAERHRINLEGMIGRTKRYEPPAKKVHLRPSNFNPAPRQNTSVGPNQHKPAEDYEVYMNIDPEVELSSKRKATEIEEPNSKRLKSSASKVNMAIGLSEKVVPEKVVFEKQHKVDLHSKRKDQKIEKPKKTSKDLITPKGFKTVGIYY